MKRNLRQSILFVLIVLLLINSSCQPNNTYSSQSDFQEDTVQGEHEPQTQPIDMEPVIIFDNINAIPHSEFPPIAPTFTLTESWRITSILVSHWNQSKGVEPGEITLRDDQGNFYGTWQAEGFAPEPQFPNTYWRVKPDMVLGPGTYIIYDSDPATETYNTESGNMGMARIKGFPDSGYLNTEGIDGIVPIDSGNPVRSITYTEKELSAEGETKDVSPESPKATAVGVTVDFGEFNLSGDGTLEVAKLPYKEDKSTGIQVQAYNITLGDIKEFPIMVEVMMPYDPGSLSNEEELYAISVGWYDASQNTWKIMPCTVNSTDNTVTFQTDHLSPFAVIKNEMNKGKAVFYYKDGQYLGPNTPVFVDTGALKQALNKIDPSSFDELIRNKSVPTNEFFSNGLGFANDLFSGSDYMIAISGLSKLKAAVGPAFTALGGVAVAVKIADQWSRGVATDKFIRDNAFDLAELIATGVLLVHSSPYIAVAAAGLWMSGMVDDVVNEEVGIDRYTGYFEKCYDYFNREHITNFSESGTCSYRLPMPGVSANLRGGEQMLTSKSDWARVVKGIYEKDKEYPNLIEDDVNSLIANYCDMFWNVPQSDMKYWIDEKSGILPEGALADNLPWPKDKAEVQYYKDRCRIRMNDRLQPLYQAMADKELADLWTQYYTAAFKLADQLNQTMYFDVEDLALTEPGFAKSSSAKNVLELKTNGEYGKKDFNCNERYTDSNQVFSCTVYHYITAGMPSQLMIFPEGADEYIDGVYTADYLIGDTISFSPDMPRTVIQLPGSTETPFHFEDPGIVYWVGYTYEFTIYISDAPPGAFIEMVNGDGYGDRVPVEESWIKFSDRFTFYEEGQYTVIARMYAKDGKLIGEDSLLVVVVQKNLEGEEKQCFTDYGKDGTPFSNCEGE